jgi:hypothetical protein
MEPRGPVEVEIPEGRQLRYQKDDKYCQELPSDQKTLHILALGDHGVQPVCARIREPEPVARVILQRLRCGAQLLAMIFMVE